MSNCLKSLWMLILNVCISLLQISLGILPNQWVTFCSASASSLPTQCHWTRSIDITGETIRNADPPPYTYWTRTRFRYDLYAYALWEQHRTVPSLNLHTGLQGVPQLKKSRCNRANLYVNTHRRTAETSSGHTGVAPETSSHSVLVALRFCVIDLLSWKRSHHIMAKGKTK